MRIVPFIAPEFFFREKKAGAYTMEELSGIHALLVYKKIPSHADGLGPHFGKPTFSRESLIR